MPQIKKKEFRLRKAKTRDQYNSSDAKKFYNSVAWRKVSKRYRDNNPLCEESLLDRIFLVANVTDHIIPISLGGAKMDQRNFQSLSHSKHNSKSAKEKIKPLYKSKKNKDGDLIPIRNKEGQLIKDEN